MNSSPRPDPAIPAPSPSAATTVTRHPLVFALGIALAALLVSLFFHSPRLWALAQPMPGSTYWDRGLQFIQQCEAPLGAPVTDAGLLWRLAPVMLAKGLGLHGTGVLLVPWFGLLLLLTQWAWLVLRRTGDLQFATLATVLLGTTSAVLTVTGWLGMNDAWYAAALLAVAFQPAQAALLLALLIGPWVDERFIFALPLALYVRSVALGRQRGRRHALLFTSTGLLIYAAIRYFNLLHLQTSSFEGYLHSVRHHFYEWWPWTSLGWFMGLRAAWVLVAVAICGGFRREDRQAMGWPAVLAVGPLVALNFLAADTGRAPTMLLPLLLLGVERAVALWGLAPARRLITVLVVANLLLPAMQVRHRTGDIINMLPVELVRLLRH